MKSLAVSIKIFITSAILCFSISDTLWKSSIIQIQFIAPRNWDNRKGVNWIGTTLSDLAEAVLVLVALMDAEISKYVAFNSEEIWLEWDSTLWFL